MHFRRRSDKTGMPGKSVWASRIGGLALSDEPGDGFCPALDVELLKNIGEVVFNRLITQIKLRGDLFIGFAFGEQWNDEPFLGRQGGTGSRGMFLPRLHTNPMQGSLRDPGIQISAAFGHRANGPHEVVRSDVFQHVPVRAASNGGDHSRIFRVTGQDQDAYLREHSQQLAAGIQTRGIRELHVEEHHLRLHPCNDGHGFRDAACFSDDLEVLFQTEEGAQTVAYDFVIIDDDDSRMGWFHTEATIGSKVNSASTLVPPPASDRTDRCPPSFFARATILAKP